MYAESARGPLSKLARPDGSLLVPWPANTRNRSVPLNRIPHLENPPAAMYCDSDADVSAVACGKGRPVAGLMTVSAATDDSRLEFLNCSVVAITCAHTPWSGSPYPPRT